MPHMDIIVVLEVLLFGLVEGVTEWLPISSTGHMILLEEVLSMQSQFGENGAAFWNLFLVFIQFGAILAVILVFFKDLWPFGKRKDPLEKKVTWRTWLYIVIACLPAAVIGILLDNLFNEYLYNFITVAITLIVYGVAFILVEVLLKRSGKNPSITSLSEFSWKTALIIGLAQVLSLIPGTSRSGVTILAALLIGVNRDTSAKFSFYVSIPIMIGATLVKFLQFYLDGNSLSGAEIGYLLIGALMAFLVSIFAVRFLVSFVRKHTFMGFGFYRIGLGVLLVILFASIPALRDNVPGIEAITTSLSGLIPSISPISLQQVVSLPCPKGYC